MPTTIEIRQAPAAEGAKGWLKGVGCVKGQGTALTKQAGQGLDTSLV